MHFGGIYSASCKMGIIINTIIFAVSKALEKLIRRKICFILCQNHVILKQKLILDPFQQHVLAREITNNRLLVFKFTRFLSYLVRFDKMLFDLFSYRFVFITLRWPNAVNVWKIFKQIISFYIIFYRNTILTSLPILLDTFNRFLYWDW